MVIYGSLDLENQGNPGRLSYLNEPERSADINLLIFPVSRTSRFDYFSLSAQFWVLGVNDSYKRVF